MQALDRIKPIQSTEQRGNAVGLVRGIPSYASGYLIDFSLDIVARVRLVSLMALGVVLVTLFRGSEIRLALLPPALLLPVRQVRLVWRFVDAEGLVGIERAVVKR